jgi:hypothetical protein
MPLLASRATIGGMSIDEGRVRASDAEREQYAGRVREATGEGRLTLDEGDERLARVYAARFRDELPGLVADLPTAHPAASTVETRPMYGPRRYHRRYGPPFFPVLLLTAVFVGLWAATGGHFFWPAILLIFFGIVLLRRARWRR